MSLPPNKRLFVFCDGTNQDGLLSWEIYEDKKIWESQQNIANSNPSPRWTFLKKPSSDRFASNVFRLSRCIAPHTDDGTLQIVSYQSGVAVPDNFEGDNAQNMKMISGNAVASKIRDAYNFIVQNYREGDKIYLFGFSRGAYTARKVAGLLDKLGLLDKTQMSFFFRHWKNLYKTSSSEGTSQKIGKDVHVEFLGVWDTVVLTPPHYQAGVNVTRVVVAVVTPPTDGSHPLKLGGGSINGGSANILGFDDASLPNCVHRARHAMGYHEERYEFLCTPFASDENNERLAQVWFPGVHSDVGGGYQEHQISDLSLLWMAGELEAVGVNLDKKYLESRLSPGKKTLEVHHEDSSLRVLDPLHVFSGNRLAILQKTMECQTTKYHRSLWGELEHVDRKRQSHLKEMNDKLVLSYPRMNQLNKIEEEFWAPRWARPEYIKDPKPQPRSGFSVYKPVLEILPAPLHEAPEEEESPECLFTDD